MEPSFLGEIMYPANCTPSQEIVWPSSSNVKPILWNSRQKWLGLDVDEVLAAVLDVAIELPPLISLLRFSI